MNSFAPYAIKHEAETGDTFASDRYQFIKFRVFDLTLEHLERQGLDADTIPHAALQDQIELLSRNQSRRESWQEGPKNPGADTSSAGNETCDVLTEKLPAEQYSTS